MHDFTKDELIKLKNALEYYSDRTSLSEQFLDENNALALQLQSMIENHCEHEICKIDYEHQAVRFQECKEIVE